MKNDITDLNEIELIELIKESRLAKDKIYEVYFEPLKKFLQTLVDEESSEELAIRVIETALHNSFYRPYFSSFDIWLLGWLEDLLLGQKISKKEFFKIFEEVELKEEKKLLKNFLLGEEATTELYKRYSKFVASKLTKSGVSKKELEDLTQEIFQIAFSHISTLKKPEAFRSWLGRISSNYAYRFMYNSRKIKEFSLDFITENEFSRLDDNLCNTDNPLKKTLRDEEITSLREGFKELNENHRVAIFLRYFKGLNYKEIAKVGGIDIKTAYRRVFYGLKKLREALKKGR